MIIVFSMIIYFRGMRIWLSMVVLFLAMRIMCTMSSIMRLSMIIFFFF
jgi:hypothetical protein